MQFLIFRKEFIVENYKIPLDDNTSLLRVHKLYQRSLGSYIMNITQLNNMSAMAYAVMPQATTGCKSSSCSKIRHVIATFIYAIITLPKHRFESQKYVKMHA